MTAPNDPPSPNGSQDFAFSISPWKVIEKALAVNPSLASVIVVVMAAFAGLAIIGSFFAFGLDFNFALRVFGLSALAYFGLVLLAAVPGMLVHILSWFTAGVFMLLTIVAVSKVVTGGHPVPEISVRCLYFWFDQGCALAESRREVPVDLGPATPAKPDSSHLPTDAWLSINRSAPWTREEAQGVGDQLRTAGWDVRTTEYRIVAEADGVLEVRYSDPVYREVAVDLARQLQDLVESETTEDVRVFDLSSTRWKGESRHIEVWMGKK